MRLGRIGELPENVVLASVGKEQGWSKPRRWIEFNRILRAQGARGGADVAFAHMMPLFLILADRWCRRRGIPQVLWYAHGSVTRRLRRAARLAARVVTSTPAGFRLQQPEPTCLGQGIDMARFRHERTVPMHRPVRVLIAGRLSPVKRVRESIEAVRRAAAAATDCDWEIAVAGATATSTDEAYAQSLREDGGSGEMRIEWLGGVAYESMPEVYRDADFLVNLSETGSLDKVILEALAAGCLPVSSNAAFCEEVAGTPLSRLAAGSSPKDVGMALAGLAGNPSELERLRRAGLDWVGREHGLERLADRLVEVFREVREKGMRARG
jgi:glycosyltransferase involved in cell wall biosynthesis